MTEQLKLIADRVKGLREISGVSAETLAREFGISTVLYSEYENGQADIPVSFIYKIAHKFGIELSAILSGEDPRLHVYSVVRKGKGLNVERRKQYKYENLAYNFVHKKAEPFMVTIEPDNEDNPVEYNSHPGQEFNYVIEGSMKIMIDNHEVILNEGDSIFYDSGYKHAMKALNDKRARFLAIIL